MKYFHLRRRDDEQMPLDPPITDAEKQWWLDQRPAFRWHITLRFGGPLFAVSMLTAAISKPEKLLTVTALWFVPSIILLAVGGGWLHAMMQDEHQRAQEVRWKRIRDELQRSLSGPQSGPQSGPPSAVHL